MNGTRCQKVVDIGLSLRLQNGHVASLESYTQMQFNGHIIKYAQEKLLRPLQRKREGESNLCSDPSDLDKKQSLV